MRYLKNAFDLYINSSIHVSLSVVALSLISIFEYGLTLDLEFILFIFLASITGYNFVKYAGVAKLHHLSLARNLRLIQLFSLLCFIGLVFLIFKLELRVVIAGGILGLITILYALPVFGKERNLRKVAGLKIFVIALVWAGSTVILPLVNEADVLSLQYLVGFFQRIAFIVVLTLPFEIRDLDYDEESLGTIPQKIGIHKTKLFGSFLLLLIFMIELFRSNFQSSGFLSLVSVLVVSGIFLWRSKREQSEYYSSFWVEAIPILYLGIFIVFRHYL
ncbi:hypothetical protein [Christiangramia salexigens]|uniref:Prenyltransferase n=1 Tax=Christiangramia salexigens TaxID=1913577 RepID=A0A1L3J7M6_9FLAO|nr:hypothetical protein [Christiangramia salexigens]APG61128.1 hypothetical protein LPB144_12275 [Christiangramia salexigens]